MTIKSILVVTDLSAHEGIAVQRASQLADAHRANIKFVYLPARANTLEEVVAQARGMDLLVLPHRRDRSTAAFFRGQAVSRLLRCCRCPVLVTREMPDSHYRRILVAVDFSPASEALVKLAANLDSRAELEIFHAIRTRDEAKLRSAEATEQAVRAYRERCLKHAKDRMLALSDSFDTRRNRFLTNIGRGDPGRQTVIQQEHSGADLVVVGKKTATAWEDFFCGSVAHRVLRWGLSDVLVVPQAYIEATAPVAAERLRQRAPRLPLEMSPAKGGLS
jgi:nucleotide-binding universal stress UspA family protein